MRKCLWLIAIILILHYGFGIGWPTRDTVTQLPAKFTETTQNIATAHPLDRIHRVFAIKEATEQALRKEPYTKLDDIPIFLKQAIVATEDRRFYQHGAVDLMSIGRALFINSQAGESVEGASTLTQQLVKNLFLTSERSWSRKIEEGVLAVALENAYEKDEILEMYLNTVYYGCGAYGIHEAAQTYFGVNPQDLTLAQCAMLAGLPQAPSVANPVAHYDAARARQQVVLAAMTEQGMISPQDAKRAYADDLHFNPSLGVTR